MSSTQTINEPATKTPTAATVDLKLEVVVLPVSDVDRSKRFYENLGWRMDGDFTNGDAFHAVQMTPPGSPCSIHFGKGITTAAPGSVKNLYLVVSDMAARRQPDALLRLIRRVALKGALTDADVVVESQGGLVFLRRLLRHLLTRPVPPALLTFASSIHNYAVIEPIGYAKSNIRSPRCYVSCAGRSDAARHCGPARARRGIGD